jgi:hypothetical protein
MILGSRQPAVHWVPDEFSQEIIKRTECKAYFVVQRLRLDGTKLLHDVVPHRASFHRYFATHDLQVCLHIYVLEIHAVAVSINSMIFWKFTPYSLAIECQSSRGSSYLVFGV